MSKSKILDKLLEEFFSDILCYRYVEGTSIFEINEELAKDIVKHYPNKKAQVGY